MSAVFRKSFFGPVIAALFGLMFSSFAAIAQNTGGVRLSVTGPDGTPVSGATVKLTSPDSLIKSSATTGSDGTARMQGLDPATNYTVEITANGFQSLSKDGVAVVSGQNLSLTYVLALTGGATQLDSIEVTGRSLAALDTTSATVGLDLTLDLVESLPTQRTYQSYLQLVPGTKPSTTGNPGSKSGVNYSDIGGVYGNSTDNIYYIDGINVTDPLTGGFGSNLNSEIIQEQRVLTSGVPAEFEGGSGLISKVVTKSGGDEFHGSVNYYFQNDSLVADYNKGQDASGFSDYDTAFTLGGPVVKEQLWFFSSFQLKNRSDDVVDPNSGDALRSVTTKQNLGFLKGTWQATNSDRVSLTYFNDPFERSGSRDGTVVNNRDRQRDQGGDNYRLEYAHSFLAQNIILSGYYYSHEGEVSDLAANGQTRNDVAFNSGSPDNTQLQLGGFGQNISTFRNRDEFGLTGQWLLYTGFGEHVFKSGIIFSENTYKTDLIYTGDGSQYTSIDIGATSVDFAEYTDGSSWTGDVDLVEDDAQRIADACNDIGGATLATCVTEMDGADGSVANGTIEAAEVPFLVFDSATDNPNGQINAYRIMQVARAPIDVQSKGTTIFVQDSWTMDKWTVNAGLRSERWEHFGTDGSNIFTFDWEIAPRLSVVFDPMGNGRSKLWGFVGRYYDPVRNDMTSFAGTLSGSVRDEQVFVGDEWVTFRQRGGAQTQDAFFAPTTKTPYTDETLLGYSMTVGEDSTLSFTYTQRNTRDILEDYDLHLYSDPTNVPVPGAPGVADGGGLAGTAFFLPYSYFGYSEAPDSNYVIGTLKGGVRNYKGYEVAWAKQRSNNWQALASYTYNDAKGNTNSDGNADFQGDVTWLDPRAPNMYGDQPGSIKHQIKLAASHFWDMGLEVGGVFNLNSGALYSRTFAASGRHLPSRVTTGNAYEFGGTTQRWVADNAVGNYSGPAFATIDARVKYTRKLPVGQGEVFVDIFNILDDQSATAEQDLSAGDGVFTFGESNDFSLPRRFYLGARYSF